MWFQVPRFHHAALRSFFAAEEQHGGLRRDAVAVQPSRSVAGSPWISAVTLPVPASRNGRRCGRSRAMMLRPSGEERRGVRQLGWHAATRRSRVGVWQRNGRRAAVLVLVEDSRADDEQFAVGEEGDGMRSALASRLRTATFLPVRASQMIAPLRRTVRCQRAALAISEPSGDQATA
jgi:hypothetical protein